METNEEITPEIESPTETSPPVETPNETSAPVETPNETSQPIETSPPVETPNETSPPVETPNEISQPVETPEETSTPVETPNKISPSIQASNEISSTINEIPLTIEITGVIKLPGFIDTHVHIHEPHEPFKENFDTGTSAALAGGITLICAMPDTSPPITDEGSFNLFQICAKSLARCDYAIYLAASENNCPYYYNCASETAGLKMFLNNACNPYPWANQPKLNSPGCNLVIPNMTTWKYHLENWPKCAPGPIVCHAEKSTMAAIILYAYIVKRPIHICHVAKKEEIMIIRLAKDRGLNVTCEVCPHHLFLTTDDIERIGENNATVKPSLGSPEDQKALWDNLNYIDVFASDHSGYTIAEKNAAAPVTGLPGLETILPLLLNAVHEGRLTMDDIIQKFYKNPKKIFNLPEQPKTFIEVNMEEEWVIPDQMDFSKANWTPYAGMKVKGKLHRVVLRDELAYINGEVLVPSGFGKDVRNKCYLHWKRCMN